MKKLSSEEAEKVLEGMKVKIEIPKAAVTQWKRNTALDMAIEALKYSEVPNSSDCISRRAAIDVLSLGKEMLSRVLDYIDVVGTDRERYSWGLELIESYINDIKELPSVTPERKKGKWIKGVGENGITTSEFCSCCRYENKHWCDWNFCPNCGADMTEDSE